VVRERSDPVPSEPQALHRRGSGACSEQRPAQTARIRGGDARHVTPALPGQGKIEVNGRSTPDGAARDCTHRAVKQPHRWAGCPSRYQAGDTDRLRFGYPDRFLPAVARGARLPGWPLKEGWLELGLADVPHGIPASPCPARPRYRRRTGVRAGDWAGRTDRHEGAGPAGQEQDESRPTLPPEDGACACRAGRSGALTAGAPDGQGRGPCKPVRRRRGHDGALGE
jgi:hypothetical protein